MSQEINEKLGKYMEEIDSITNKAVALGFDTLIVFRHPTDRSMFTSEHRVSDESPPVCHRFNEIASCRTKIIDIALLLRDCFTEVVTKNKGY